MTSEIGSEVDVEEIGLFSDCKTRLEKSTASVNFFEDIVVAVDAFGQLVVGFDAEILVAVSVVHTFVVVVEEEEEDHDQSHSCQREIPSSFDSEESSSTEGTRLIEEEEEMEELNCEGSNSGAEKRISAVGRSQWQHDRADDAEDSASDYNYTLVPVMTEGEVVAVEVPDDAMDWTLPLEPIHTQHHWAQTRDNFLERRVEIGVQFSCSTLDWHVFLEEGLECEEASRQELMLWLHTWDSLRLHRESF